MSRLGLTRDKIYRTVARQLHGVVPCWVCGKHVEPAAATLEHIRALSDGGNSHADNLAISHGLCNGQRHARSAGLVGTVPEVVDRPDRLDKPDKPDPPDKPGQTV